MARPFLPLQSVLNLAAIVMLLNPKQTVIFPALTPSSFIPSEYSQRCLPGLQCPVWSVPLWLTTYSFCYTGASQFWNRSALLFSESLYVLVFLAEVICPRIFKVFSPFVHLHICLSETSEKPLLTISTKNNATLNLLRCFSQLRNWYKIIWIFAYLSFRV